MQIVVLGMHRSGTSAVTGLLVKMGAYFGPQGIAMPGNFANPDGFWERMDVVGVDDELLAASGAAWNAPLDYDRAKIPPAVMNPLLDRARAIASDLSTQPVSVVKDPRMCLTADVWLPLFPQPVCLFVMRDPLAIARSLQKRGDCSIATGMAMWEAYLRASLRAARSHPIVTLDYDRLMADAETELARLVRELRELGLSTSLASLAKDDIAILLKADLRHHVTTRAELAGYAAPPQFAFFDELCRSPLRTIADVAVSAVSQDALRYFAERETVVRRRLDVTMARMAASEKAHHTAIGDLQCVFDRAAAHRDALRETVALLMAETEGARNVMLDEIRKPELIPALWLSRVVRRRGVTSADIQAVAQRLSAAWAAGREALDNSGDRQET